MSEKLQKVLANLGLGSRREAERWIADGRVSVNGQLVTLGERVEPQDEIRFDGNVVKREQTKSICRVLIYNKPEGELCTRHDPEGRPTVFSRLPNIKNGRWITVGRLDINTSGLLLFSNDGELANRLMHPKHEVQREYAVRIFGEVDDRMLRRLKRGVKLEDGMAKFDKIKRRQGDSEAQNAWFDVVLKEGRNREVRRIWESQEVKVSRLIRTRYGDVSLPKRLPQGAWVELELEELNALRKSVQLPPESESMIDERQAKLDHVRLSRMRRSVKKHKLRTASGDAVAKPNKSKRR